MSTKEVRVQFFRRKLPSAVVDMANTLYPVVDVEILHQHRLIRTGVFSLIFYLVESTMAQSMELETEERFPPPLKNKGESLLKGVLHFECFRFAGRRTARNPKGGNGNEICLPREIRGGIHRKKCLWKSPRDRL